MGRDFDRAFELFDDSYKAYNRAELTSREPLTGKMDRDHLKPRWLPKTSKTGVSNLRARLSGLTEHILHNKTRTRLVTLLEQCANERGTHVTLDCF